MLHKKIIITSYPLKVNYIELYRNVCLIQLYGSRHWLKIALTHSWKKNNACVYYSFSVSFWQMSADISLQKSYTNKQRNTLPDLRKIWSECYLHFPSLLFIDAVGRHFYLSSGTFRAVFLSVVRNSYFIFVYCLVFLESVFFKACIKVNKYIRLARSRLNS